MNAPSPERMLPPLVSVAQQAGEAILDVYRRDFDVTHKEDRTPLTQADLTSHRIIRDALERLAPDLPLLSEESSDIPFTTRSGWTRYWLVDPLDGTREFVSRNGEFTVNIALIDHHLPVLGVVHVPVSGATYFGVPGQGAWRQSGTEPPAPIATRVPAARPPVVVGSRSHANPRLRQCLAPIGEYDLVSMGSSLKFCLVAEGSADLYPRLGPTSEWDTAAAQAVVEAAGGEVVALDGEPLRYNRKEDYLNPWFLVVGDRGAGWLEQMDLSF